MEKASGWPIAAPECTEATIWMEKAQAWTEEAPGWKEKAP